MTPFQEILTALIKVAHFQMAECVGALLLDIEGKPPIRGAAELTVSVRKELAIALISGHSAVDSVVRVMAREDEAAIKGYFDYFLECMDELNVVAQRVGVHTIRYDLFVAKLIEKLDQSRIGLPLVVGKRVLPEPNFISA